MREDEKDMPIRSAMRQGLKRAVITGGLEFAHLAERVGLMKLTRRLATERGIAVLFTEHDMDVVFDVSDRILVLNRGTLIAEGNGTSIRANPAVREIYLGTGATSGGH